MSLSVIITVIVSYFSILILVSYFTSRNVKSESFFTGERKSPWYIVAFGMIGATLSGVTFISIPGIVGAHGVNQQMAYMQVVLGNILGYIVISFILLPIYYKLNLTSIYTFLGKRFGNITNKMSSFIFIISKAFGAAIRLYLVVIVVQFFLMDAFNVPFYITAGVTILLILIYTFKGGIKTVVWTDAIQTLVMLLSLTLTIVIVCNQLNLNIDSIPHAIKEANLGKIFFFNNGWGNENFFFKQFLSGVFITIVMNGLDQDMMQKSLTCKNINDARKNILSVGFILVPVVLLFLIMGALLSLYLTKYNISVPTDLISGKEKYDLIFPMLALNNFGSIAGILFLCGLTAAAFSSADSTLTALTTSFSVDFLGIDVKNSEHFTKKRQWIHIGFAIFLFLIIVGFKLFANDSIINLVFKTAGYTYGPLLGFFSFGILSKRKVIDWTSIFIGIAAPLLTLIISLNSEEWFRGYKMGFENLIWNGVITYAMMYISSLFVDQTKYLEEEK